MIFRGAAKCLAPALAALLSCHAAFADGLLRIANCRIVDDSGPVKAMGVNYVNGFWGFAADGKREAYLPYLDALAEAKIPFIRMAFGPWANYKPDEPEAPQIADFVAHRDQYFARLDTFLTDLKARHIGAVLDVFWNVEPYTVHFGEPLGAVASAGSKTMRFLTDTVAELARRQGRNPTIWMVEFANEGDLGIDYPKAMHTRADLVAEIGRLAAALRAGGDKHLIDSGNSAPRPAAEHLARGQGWKPDSRDEFFHALDVETTRSAQVASVHLYPEKPSERPWDGGDVMDLLSAIANYSQKACRPVFIGEFGAKDLAVANLFEQQIRDSAVTLSAVWGFGRPSGDPFGFGIDPRGKAILRSLALTRP